MGLGANEIHGINLTNTGDFVANSTSLAFTLPQSHTVSGSLISNPVSDIAFSSNGKMLISERTMCCPDEGGAHRATVMELVATTSGNWGINPSASFFAGPEKVIKCLRDSRRG